MNFQILDSIGIARELNVAKAFKENQIQFYETRIKKVKGVNIKHPKKQNR
jgi:hypothetical protein